MKRFQLRNSGVWSKAANDIEFGGIDATPTCPTIYENGIPLQHKYNRMCTTSVRVSPAFARHRSRETISTSTETSVQPFLSRIAWARLNHAKASASTLHFEQAFTRYRPLLNGNIIAFIIIMSLGIASYCWTCRLWLWVWVRGTWALDAAIALLLKCIEYWIRTNEPLSICRKTLKKGARAYPPPLSLSACLAASCFWLNSFFLVLTILISKSIESNLLFILVQIVMRFRWILHWYWQSFWTLQNKARWILLN